MLAIGILVVGVLSRFLVHLPNFTPVIALALFSGVYLNKKQAVILPLLLMGLSDIFLGTHITLLFTWGSIALIAAFGLWLRERKSALNIFMFSLLSAVVFFIVTNLGVWLVAGLYPMTAAGLVECFTLAIPFFKHSLVSTLAYSAVFFGAYELVAKGLKNTKFASVL